MSDESPHPEYEGWRDEPTAYVVAELSESDKAALEVIMGEEWAMLRTARLLGIISAIEQRVEALEAEVRALRER